MGASSIPDVCVIGAGAGGLAMARGAAALGLSTVLIEKGEMSGQSLHRGSVPSQALIAAGRTALAVRTAGRLGIRAQEHWVDYPRTRAYWGEAIASIKPNQTAARMEAMRVKVIRGAARFVSRTAVEVDGMSVTARRFVVATGSSAATFPIPGLEQIRSLTTDTLFDLETLPGRLIVVGAAEDGLALAQALRRLGSEVTILESARALADEDPELAEILLAQLASEGIVLRENAEILRVEPRGGGVRVILKGRMLEETVDGSHLLIAAGRRPNVEGMGLATAGIEFDRSGIKVDRHLRSTNRQVYAIGDVAGLSVSVAAATHHASAVLRRAFMHLPADTTLSTVPRIIFTDPEIAIVGLREDEARRRYGIVRVLRWPFAENDRARIEGVAAGHVKAIVSRRDTILGVGIVGPRAAELIGSWQLAIANGLKTADIMDMVAAYPTLSEASIGIAAAAAAAGLRNPLAARALRLMRALG
jgi:pyruvate/2-oxoglutarate dehydrogenase complex dihydrolipoamide dehydrogenase (E3) component